MEKTKYNIKTLSDRQKEIAFSIINTVTDDVKYHIIRASRKSGKSYLFMRLVLYSLIKHSNFEIGFMSATYRVTQSFYRDFIKIIPVQMIVKANQDSFIQLINGSTIDFYSANSPVVPVNRSFNELYLDEFALYSRKDVWNYLRPTVIAKPNAKCIIASTPRGKNQFFDMCQLGIAGKARHKEYRMSWTDNILINPQDIEDAKLSMPLQLFNQEFNCDFTDAVSGVFGDFKHVLTVNEWTEPQMNSFYFYGIDVAGVGNDRTILTILDQQGKVHLIYECVSGDMVIQADELTPLIMKFNAIGYVEKTGIGQGLADILKSKSLNVKYWNTTNVSKQRLVTGLILNFNKNEIQLPTDKLCPKLENELSCYSGKRTSTGLISYHGEAGVHDDYVISLMLANEARKKLGSGLRIFNPNPDDDEEELALTPEYMPMYLRKSRVWSDSLKY